VRRRVDLVAAARLAQVVVRQPVPAVLRRVAPAVRQPAAPVAERPVGRAAVLPVVLVAAQQADQAVVLPEAAASEVILMRRLCLILVLTLFGCDGDEPAPRTPTPPAPAKPVPQVLQMSNKLPRLAGDNSKPECRHGST
jgi:hypothetical protein